MAIVKKRNWAFVLYPDSAPEDWRERLQQTGLTCAVSPLHDRDTNPTGELKKEHWHVIISYSGPTSYNVVKKLTDSLNAPIPQPLEQVRGYYRYLTHKDNPEKAQYDEADITFINGFNIQDFVELSRREVDEYKIRLLHLIRERGIFEYADFIDCILNEQDAAYFNIASSNTIFFERYISSRRNSLKAMKEKK